MTLLCQLAVAVDQGLALVGLDDDLLLLADGHRRHRAPARVFQIAIGAEDGDETRLGRQGLLGDGAGFAGLQRHLLAGDELGAELGLVLLVQADEVRRVEGVGRFQLVDAHQQGRGALVDAGVELGRGCDGAAHLGRLDRAGERIELVHGGASREEASK